MYYKELKNRKMGNPSKILTNSDKSENMLKHTKPTNKYEQSMVKSFKETKHRTKSEKPTQLKIVGSPWFAGKA